MRLETWVRSDRIHAVGSAPDRMNAVTTNEDRSAPIASYSRWVWLTAIVWAAVLLACCGRALLLPHKSVYPIFALAAQHWIEGQDLYGQLAPGLDRYRYSPLVAALLVPFSLLPDGLGAVLWRLANAMIYLASLGWWIRAILPRSLTRTQLAALFLLVVPLSVGSLNNGQSNALVLGLLLAGLAAVQSERWNLSAGCIATACLFKVYPIAVGLLLTLVYPRRFAGRLAVALGVGLALPFWLQQSGYVAGQYLSWWEHFQTYDRQCLIVELWYRDIRLLLRGWLGPVEPQTYAAIQLLAAGAVAGLCLAGRRARWSEDRLLLAVFGLGCCWMTLVGPATESCTYILVAPTLAWALLDAWQTCQSPAALALFLGSYGLFLACQIAVWFPIGRTVHTLGLQPLAGLLLLAGILTTHYSPHRHTSPAFPS